MSLTYKKIKKNDIVVVITGDYKSRGGELTKGKVLKVDRKRGRVVVEGVNYVRKAIRPSQRNPKGGIIETEGSIHISNVMLFCPKCSKGVKVKFEVKDGRKVRVCKKCGHIFD